MDYKEASKRLGISVGTVYNWLKSGKLEGVKDENGDWDISIDSVNKILGQYENEANLVRFEMLIDNYVEAKEASILKTIYHYCKDFIGNFEANNDKNVVVLAERIAEKVKEIQSFRNTKEVIGQVINDEFTPFEILNDEEGGR